MGRQGTGIQAVIFVLDASAMIAFLRDEPGAETVAEALLDLESRCYAHALNLCEVFYDFHRASGRGEALGAIADLARVGVIEDAHLDSGVWQAAGTLKANLRRVSLADCFAIDLADRMQATILTADHHEFDVLAGQSDHVIRFIR
jgi:PIN domain nuclease of toxin-antitoxin system